MRPELHTLTPERRPASTKVTRGTRTADANASLTSPGFNLLGRHLRVSTAAKRLHGRLPAYSMNR
jgi:hypothetical protein